MKLVGEIVTHKAFGKGKIVGFENNNVTVSFEKGNLEKKFVYPTAFEAFLKLENEVLNTHVNEEHQLVKATEMKDRKDFENRVKLKSIQSAKVNKPNYVDKCNIAFKFNYCECDAVETVSEDYKYVCYEGQPEDTWSVNTGIVQSGKNKGKSMVLKNVSANSLAILTTKLPHAPEEERFIFSVFLIDENYSVTSKGDGYVKANPKYKMAFTLEEAQMLKFWEYYFNPNKPDKIVLGSALHRYFSDEQAAQVLLKICEIKAGTEDEAFAQAFFEYFCSIKGLENNRISPAKGGLRRI